MLALNKKIVKLFTISLILFFIICNHVHALVQQSTEFYVNDTANILSNETKEYIISINQNLESQTGAQIVVVTVTDLEGLGVEDYATQLFRKYRYW